MKMHSVLAMAAAALMVPALARAQAKKITCADHTIVTADAACADHGGVQKAGGLHQVGKQLNKAAIDVKDEAKRTPSNIKSGANTVGHNVSEAAGDVGKGAKKTAKKVRHGAGEAAGDVSKGAQKVVHPTTYRANCKDGTTWKGREKSNACLNHGGVSNWP